MKSLKLKVSGMHCGSCEMLVKEALEDAGVKTAIPSHKNGTVDVVFDENKIKESKIKTIIEQEGYKVE